VTAEELFEADPDRPALAPGEELRVNLEGYEGPLDLLLDLARKQKVDLARISVLRLAEQYLAFIAEAKKVRLEIAADYLVMAAWLAYLKSRLLLPPEEKPVDEPSGEELAAQLQRRLRLLEMIREVADKLMGRPRLGLNVFGRGAPEGVRTITSPIWLDTYTDLLRAYSDHRARVEGAVLHVRPIQKFTVEDALQRLRRLLGGVPDWATLEAFLPADLRDGAVYRNAVATTLVASLELVKSGRLELRQPQPFGPIFVRRRDGETRE